ncbi:uncharacterized protein LOC133794355 [Humulus lupulus]|uniref:uncharacterized protein LOC133794355 n=1 Tax=Humulus lupulus TaxID=3486 RepID=UPI002B41674C|nr:uncharacterized protein LOC133794355 [Humulus lupulus]
MEQNAPVVAKKIWDGVRVVFFMLRKGISKKKLLLDLNMMMKRGKIASKAAITNLMAFHAAGSTSSRRSNVGESGPRLSSGEYEFSCSNTPNYGPFNLGKPRRNHSHNFFGCAHAPPTLDDDVVTANALKAVLEILNNDQAVMNAAAGVEASPALPGFGRSPMVRQLRITDSPFPLREADEDSRQVDEAAEEFIKRFYKDLRLQQ